MSPRTLIAGLGGGAITLGFGLVGFLLWGIPGEIAGLVLSLPIGVLFGVYIGGKI